MLQGKGGAPADNIGVELYFKSLEGILRSIDEFNYKEVAKAEADQNYHFAKVCLDTEKNIFENTNLSTQLALHFSEKKVKEKDHFRTMLTLMYAHSNLVLFSY